MERMTGSSEAPKPRLNVVGFGGTIMSMLHKEGDASSLIIKPRQEGINELIASLGDDIEAFDGVRPTVIEPLIDSSQAIAAKHICNVVSTLRRKLAEDNADAIIILYGTDTMADLMNALGNGVSKKELGDKSVVVTCAMRHLQHERTDAFDNFRKAALLARMKETRGKIGLCIGERFMPPRGIEKVGLNTDLSFICRFRRMAKYEDGAWNFDRMPEPYDEPRGQEGRAFELRQGVESIELTATSSYKNLISSIRSHRGTIFKAPGNGNLRNNRRSFNILRRAATLAGGPIIAVGQAIQNGETEPETESLEDELYAGDSTLFEIRKLVSGGAMTATEARILLSQWLAEAEKHKLNTNDTVAFVHEQIKLYPFRFTSDVTWRKKETETEAEGK